MKFYRMRIYKALPDVIAEFDHFFRTRLLPVQLRHGARLVGRWHTEDSRIVAIWEYDSREDYDRIQGAVASDPDSLAAQEFRRLNLPRTYSEMEEVFMTQSPIGTPEEWFFTGAIIRDPSSRRVLLQLRDDVAPVNPGQWGLFGGGSEPGETPVQCLIRELGEELGVVVEASDVVQVRSYVNPRTSRPRHIFLIETLSEETVLILGEGAALEWVSLDDALQRDLTKGTEEDLTFLAAEMGVRR